MSNEDILKAIQLWQSDKHMHPLTCGSKNCRKELKGTIEKGKVILICSCGYKQYHIPRAVLKKYEY